MKEDSEKVPSLLTDYILKGGFYDGAGAAIVSKCVLSEIRYAHSFVNVQ